MTIEEFLKYLRYELNYSVHTVLSYKNDLDQFSGFLGGDENESLKFANASQSDVRRWMMARSNAGDAPRTIRRKVQAVRALYKYMERIGEIDDNPADEVELAKVPQRLPKTQHKFRVFLTFRFAYRFPKATKHKKLS